MGFHQRNVLVGGRVVDDLWPVVLDRFVEFLPIEDVAEHRNDAEPRILEPQLQLREVEAAFGSLEEHQELGLQRGQLPAEGRADRAPGLCDHDPLASKLPLEKLTIQANNVAADENLRIHLVELRDRGLAAQQLLETRNGPERDRPQLARVDNAANLLSVGRGDGDENFLDIIGSTDER